MARLVARLDLLVGDDAVHQDLGHGTEGDHQDDPPHRVELLALEQPVVARPVLGEAEGELEGVGRAGAGAYLDVGEGVDHRARSRRGGRLAEPDAKADGQVGHVSPLPAAG